MLIYYKQKFDYIVSILSLKNLMKTNNLKLIYPKHFITTFSIEDQTKITVVDLITLVKDKGILQSE